MLLQTLMMGTIIISDKFDINAATGSSDFTPYFYAPEDEYVVSFTNLQNVIKFTKFQYDTLGLSDERYLLQYYRVSRRMVFLGLNGLI